MITRSDVDHVARLARLHLEQEEAERMVDELASILGHIDKISQLDLDQVEPTSQVLGVENALREDVPSESLPRERALAAAPHASGGGFGVPSPTA